MNKKNTIQEDFPYFDEIRRHLAITWDDEDTNLQIKDYIIDGKNHLINLCGDSNIDFETDIEAKKLLKEYCRYARNYSIEAFNDNFSDDLLRFQIKHAINDYDETPTI